MNIIGYLNITELTFVSFNLKDSMIVSDQNASDVHATTVYIHI